MAKDSNNKELVILLHGLGRGPAIMSGLDRHLYSLGYETSSQKYPSRQFTIIDSVKCVYSQIKSFYENSEQTIHFVGHSLGAIVVRMLLGCYRPKNLGRVVMIAPPNHGSEVAEFLGRFFWYKKLYGPAGYELGTGEHAICHKLPKVNYDAGVIAGDRSVDWFFSWFILPGLDDGKVTVASTKVDGMRDHITVHSAHPFMPKNNDVIAQTAFFLREGRFNHS